MSQKRAKGEQTTGGGDADRGDTQGTASLTATRAPLPPPPPPPADPCAGVNALKSGRGTQLRSPAAAQLLAALSLFDDQPGSAGAAAAAPGPVSGSGAGAAAAVSVLPTGACWPLVSLVTPNGLQTHAVAPDAEMAPRNVRDPQRLAASKRRACEE